MRIAMIGLGDIAIKAYLPLIARHPSIEPILSTRNKEKLHSLAKQYRINETYSTLVELIAAKPDAVMIHTATGSHFEIAKQFLDAGIACFVDKPLSYQYTECEELVSIARRTKTPLYVGFNRRFAPLISPLSTTENVHIRWQKHRVNLPAQAREFIYDDFIHVVDGLRYLSVFSQPIDIKLLKVTPTYHHNLLSSIHFTYPINEVLIEGHMNRLSGVTEERLEVFSENQKVEVNNLTHGFLYQNSNETRLKFDDWQSYFYTRGFVDMIEDWLEVIKQGYSTDQQLDDVLSSHQLCELILNQIEQ
ncbi:Gfo/Idh/MocA family protein [Colwelliaceae bacterium 6441]